MSKRIHTVYQFHPLIQNM